MNRQNNENGIKPEGFFSSLFSGKNNIYSAIVLSLVISLALMFIFKNRMFLLIIPILPLQIAYRKMMEFFKGKKKNRLERD